MQSKALFTILITLPVFLVGGGCASIKIHRPAAGADPNLHGLKVYPPKPYLLVSRAGDGGKTISVSTIMLPDLGDPHYIRPQTGVGKADLNLAIENGILKTYGSATDSKTAEIIKEVAALATGYGAIAKTLAEAGKIREETNQLRLESADLATLLKASNLTDSAAKLLDAIRKDASTGLSPQQITALEGFIAQLNGIAQSLQRPTLPSEPLVQYQFAKQLTTIAEDIEKLSATVPALPREKFATPLAEIRAAAGLIAEKPPAKATFELYEIIGTASGAITLRLVPQ
jgi:hypothetical protein